MAHGPFFNIFDVHIMCEVLCWCVSGHWICEKIHELSECVCEFKCENNLEFVIVIQDFGDSTYVLIIFQLYLRVGKVTCKMDFGTLTFEII